MKLRGVCNHHDLGPLGAAFNYRARERQLELLAEMGSNAIRTAHNPFEPEFLELADRLGFLVLDEAFDVWERPKAAFDYNVLFPEWHEPDLRALIRRDRNHPSVILWSIGNEVGEQTDPSAGPALAERLTAISHEEDPTRPTTAGMNVAEPHWRPELPMAHLLPHWTWPERVGQVTPVHVYTSGDSAELFVNGVSQGRLSKAQYQYRLRWDDVVYEPGELRVVAYKDGAEWATDSVATAGPPSQLGLVPDRASIAADGRDLSFITLSVLDAQGRLAPRAADTVTFAVTGPGELVATANGDATNGTVFSSPRRDAFSGKALAIVRALPGQAGEIVVTATAAGLAEARLAIRAE